VGPEHSPGDRFYHELVMAAGSVLDVGCGTGAMLACAREHGYRGRLTGLDPDGAALERARRQADVEWAGAPRRRRVGRASLRFLDTRTLGAFLNGTGFEIESQYGDWHRGPITSTSREIITIARRKQPAGDDRR
jgi:SAM-dependent methyltransferase